MNRRIGWCAAMALVIVLVASYSGLDAIHIRPDLENVPIDRIVSNLERLVEESPRDVELRVNLARVHSMAFAFKTDTGPVWRGRERAGVWAGYVPEHTQFETRQAGSAGAARAAAAHLRRAIARYEEALELAPANLVARLGLGWCLVQAGETPRAVTELRRVISEAWPADRRAGHRFEGSRSLTEEAARYLMPLLDPVADRPEIAVLRDRLAELDRLPRAITPIAIPLADDRDALAISSSSTVAFDADGSGLRRRWTWITPDAAWLVYDHRGSGRIDSALQMFGSVSFWLFWANGYHAMRALDDDGDSWLAGPELDGLALWQDADSDGVSDPGEVRPLVDHGIVALSCAYRFDAGHPDEIAFSPSGVLLSDGRVRPSFDLVLHAQPR